MAKVGYELETPGPIVKCTTDCAMELDVVQGLVFYLTFNIIKSYRDDERACTKK